MTEPVPLQNRRIKLVVTIAERGKGSGIKEVCDKIHKAFHLNFMGHGTAPTRVLEYLGLSNSEKDIIFSVVPEELAPKVLEGLKHELELDRHGGGIAFSIPVSSVGSPMTLKLISQIEEAN